MSKRIACLSLFVCLLMAVPASAGIVYSNGAPSLTTTPTYQISGKIANVVSSVSDTFTVLTNGTFLTSAQVAIWFPTGDNVSSLNYCISGTSDFCSSLIDESGTGVSLTNATLVGTSGSFTLDEFTFALLNHSYAAGTYWLTLNNASVSNGGNAYWDENGGVGCIGDGNSGSPGNGCPSGGGWSLQENPIATQGSTTNNHSEAFEIDGPSGAPEPGSITLMGSGMLLLAGFLRRARR